ncbi:MAG TPA: FemAB family XrtA/PEP-CTERM system-associated protein [Longimicrobiales bacterium]
MSEPLTVEAVAGAGAAWDDFVDRSPDASFAHLWRWRTVLADVYGHDARYLVAKDADGRWRGVLPLVRLRSRLFGRHLVSVPLLNHGGAIGAPAARAQLAEHAAEEARRWGADTLVLRQREPVACALPTARHKVTVALELPDSPATLWRETLRSKVRSQIRRAMKEAMDVRFGPDQRRAFHEVYARNMRDLGTPAHPPALFEAIAGAFPEHVVFGAVYRHGRPVAGGCGFRWRDAFEMTWASSLREFNRMAPNMLLYWAFMEEMTARGVRVFDFGRCTPGSATHRFKLQWGGAELPLPWLHWSRRGAPPDTPGERPPMRWARAAWRRLPATIADRLGPAVARELPWW